MEVSIRFIVVLGILVCSSGCLTNQDDFVAFLRSEINSLGGRTNGLGHTKIYGRWTVTRDGAGTAIETQNIEYQAITNLFSKAYGNPIFHSRATEKHGPTFVWPVTNVGVAIFVRTNRTDGVAISLTKPIGTEGLNPRDVLQEFRMKQREKETHKR